MTPVHTTLRGVGATPTRARGRVSAGPVRASAVREGQKRAFPITMCTSPADEQFLKRHMRRRGVARSQEKRVSAAAEHHGTATRKAQGASPGPSLCQRPEPIARLARAASRHSPPWHAPRAACEGPGRLAAVMTYFRRRFMNEAIKTHFLNVDLELCARQELTDLVQAFEPGASALNSMAVDDGILRTWNSPGSPPRPKPRSGALPVSSTTCPREHESFGTKPRGGTSRIGVQADKPFTF